MLTKFGIELRKIRLDRNLLLGDMAKKIAVSSAFVSAVENGKKNIPEDYIGKITRELSLTEAEQKKLEEAAELSQKTISFDMDGAPAHNREVLTAFARRFNTLEESKANEILKLLKTEV